MAESRLALKQLERGNNSRLFLITNGSNILEYQNFDEYVDDRVNALLTQGSGISLSYNDAGNSLTISTTGLVDTTGTPANNQVAVFTDADTIEGTSGLTFDNTSLAALDVTSTTAGARLTLDHDAASDGNVVFKADGSITWSIVDTATSQNLEIVGSNDVLIEAVNVELFGRNEGFGSSTAGQGVLKLNDVSVTPSGTLGSGGGLLYVTGTDLVFYDDGGTATTLTWNPNAEWEDSLGSDGDYFGDKIVGVAGATVAFGDLVYLNSSSQWALADADAYSTASGMLGITLGSATSGNPVDVLVRGTIRAAAFPVFTAADKIWVSTTAGDVTATVPTGSGDIQRIVGYALDANTLWFDPDTSYTTKS